MLARDIRNLWYARSKQPKSEQTKRWLLWLAKRLKEESQTEFLIEKMQPDWLQNCTQKGVYRLGFGLIYGLIIGLAFGMASGLVNNLGSNVLSKGLVLGLVYGLVYGPVLGLFFGLREKIKPAEDLKWSWLKTWSKPLGGSSLGLIVGLIVERIVDLGNALPVVGASFGLILDVSGASNGIIGGLILGLIGGLEEKIIPVETLKLSGAKIWSGLVEGMQSGMSFGLILWLSTGLDGTGLVLLSGGVLGWLHSALFYMLGGIPMG